MGKMQTMIKAGSLTLAGLVALCLGASGVGAWSGVQVDTGVRISRDLRTATTPPSNFLYSVAMEYAQAGRYDEAVGQLRKCLLVNPYHPGAMEQLRKLEQRKALREVVMEKSLDCITGLLDMLKPSRTEYARRQRSLLAQRKALREVVAQETGGAAHATPASSR